MAILDAILTKIRSGQVEFSQHAADQSIARRISVRDFREAIEDSEIIEHYPNYKYGPSCQVLGFSPSLRPLHIQYSYPSRPLIKVTILYEPDPLRWIDFKVRRKDDA